LRARENKLQQKIEQIRNTIKATQTSRCSRRHLKLNQLRIQLKKEQKALHTVNKLQAHNSQPRAEIRSQQQEASE
jgi:ribosomal protein S6